MCVCVCGQKKSQKIRGRKELGISAASQHIPVISRGMGGRGASSKLQQSQEQRYQAAPVHGIISCLAVLTYVNSKHNVTSDLTIT